MTVFHRDLSFPVQVVLLGLTAVVLSSCGNQGFNPFAGEPSPTTTAASPTPTSTPPTPGQSADTGLIEQPTSCETANYSSEVIWENDQPRMTLVQRASEANGYADTTNLNKASATRTVNSDRSLTYAATIEGGTIFTRVFPTGDCFIQSVASTNGAIVFEENGRIRGSNPQPPASVSVETIQPPPVTDPTGPVNPNQGRPPVVDPTGPITPPPPKPPVVDPTGPVKPSQPGPAIVPPGPISKPIQPKPAIVPPGPVKPSPVKPPVGDLTRPTTSGQDKPPVNDLTRPMPSPR